MKKYIEPFKDNIEGYNYFSLEKMTAGMPITQKVYEDAQQIINNGEAVIEKAELGYTSIKNSLQFNFYTLINQKHTVLICIQRDVITQIRCNVPNSISSDCWHGHCNHNLCKYEVAGLILLHDYIRKYRPGDSTDFSALRFLSFFRSENSKNNGIRTPSVILLPLLSHGSELNLRLMITTKKIGRAYIIRNITELIELEADGGKLPLGKKYEVDFAVEGFDEKSQKFADLIKNWINEKKIRQRNSSMNFFFSRDDDEMKSSICLFGYRLDSFFDIFFGQNVEDNEHRNHYFLIKEEDPKLKLKIQKLTDENNVFEGITVYGELPDIYYGSDWTYCLTDDSLCRIQEDYSKKIAPLISLSDQGNDIYFHIGRKKLAEFYYSVLPALRETVSVQELDSEIIENYLPPEVFFRFYLDIDNGVPECRVETRYGETGVAIFDLLKSSILQEDFRDVYREQQTLETVLHYFPDFQREQERFMAYNDEDSIYEIIENAVPALMQLGEVQSTQRFQNIHIRKKLGITVGVSIESDLLDLKITTEDISQNELLDIIKSYRQRKKYHRLRNGEFINMDDSIAELSSMIETMHISPKDFVKGKMKLPVYRALYLDKMLEQSQDIYTRRDSHYKQLIKNFKTVTESDFEIPESLHNVMRSYQRFGHKWLRTLESFGFGGILADDMGLGKTLQMVSVLLAAKEENIKGTSLIVCPASLIFNWAAEFEKFASQLKICTVAGSLKERATQIADYQSYDILITSYDLIKRDIASYESCKFYCQVIDEAQYIKNHNTAASKAVKLINSLHRFALTGTPIENRLSELWSIFDYLMPGFLYGYDTFKKEFETPIVKHSDEEAAKRLSRMTAPFILRRLKNDVLRDLPEKLEEDYIVRLEEEQQHIYDAKVLELRRMLDSESEESYQSSKLKVLSMLTQIRQICCDPSLLYENFKGVSAKKSACMEIVRRAIEGEHRVLIFSQFTSMLDILEKELTEQNIPYFMITGETSKKKRLELVDSFNAGDTPVFLISLKAGGTGLNLTGADVVIHYDPWWNVAAQNQATDRAHRIGQTKTVTVYKLIAQNTIEERIKKMQSRKQELADSVLTGEFVNLSSLSKDELLEILN